jgi:hypothetical protein
MRCDLEGPVSPALFHIQKFAQAMFSLFTSLHLAACEVGKGRAGLNISMVILL